MERHRRTGFAVLIALILTSGLVACSGFSLAGGLAGGLLTVVAIVMWFATAATQTSCSVQSCLSLVAPDSGFDEDVGPCLSFIGDTGVDAGVDAGEVGPCLGAPLDVGPCLTAPPPDVGFEDGGDDAGIIGPCLSQPPPDAEVDDDAGEPDTSTLDVAARPKGSDPTLARREVIDRLAKRGVLPSDVAARLRGDGDEEA